MSKISKFKRIQQWCVFARQWWLYDAKWQDPFDSAHLLARYLRGGHKPIYDVEQDMGDHVVVYNARHIALPDDEWRWRMYYHHNKYAKGKSWGAAHELHLKDPTIVLYKAIYRELNDPKDDYIKHRKRMERIARLHLYPDDQIPEHILVNCNDQIRQLRPADKRIDEFSKETIDNFPKITDYPDDYAVK